MRGYLSFYIFSLPFSKLVLGVWIIYQSRSALRLGFFLGMAMAYEGI